VKAEIQLAQRERDAQDARAAIERSRIGFGVLLFVDYTQDFEVADDLMTAPSLPARAQAEEMAGRNNPDIRAAQTTVRQQQSEVASAPPISRRSRPFHPLLWRSVAPPSFDHTPKQNFYTFVFYDLALLSNETPRHAMLASSRE